MACAAITPHNWPRDDLDKRVTCRLAEFHMTAKREVSPNFNAGNGAWPFARAWRSEMGIAHYRITRQRLLSSSVHKIGFTAGVGGMLPGFNSGKSSEFGVRDSNTQSDCHK